MKILALVLTCILLLFSLSAMALQLQGDTVTLSPAESRACEAGGGCLLMPRMAMEYELEKIGKQAYEAGVTAGARAGYEVGYQAAVDARKGSI